jgi:hypothetical protein
MNEPALVQIIADHVSESEKQIDELERLVEPLSQAQLDWRPAPDRWSVGEHLMHLAVANAPYIGRMKQVIERARARGLTSDGPYRSTWMGSRFARSMEPPPKRRIRTFRSMLPRSAAPKADVVRAFQESMRDVMAVMRLANGVDLGRATMRSPFFFLLKLNLQEAFQTILAHNRRHFWLAREVMARPDFPA